MRFGVEWRCVDFLEAGFNAEDGVGCEGYVHEWADRLYREWLAAGLIIDQGWSLWLDGKLWWGSRGSGLVHR